jgi:hypothetical protein
MLRYPNEVSPVYHPDSVRSSLSYQIKMFLTTLLALAAVVEAVPQGTDLSVRQGSTTMLRFGCPQIVIDRIDPLVNPGQVPSTHVHQMGGGNAFNASMTTSDVSNAATCTTCKCLNPHFNVFETYGMNRSILRGLLKLLDSKLVLQSPQWYL